MVWVLSVVLRLGILLSSVLSESGAQQDFLRLSHQAATTEWYTTTNSSESGSSSTVVITVTENGQTHTVRHRDGISVLLGTHIAITCVDSDTRYSSVTWYDADANVTATSFVPESILQLQPVRRTDSGDITCVTNNSQGDSHWRTVRIKPMSRRTFLNHDRGEDLTFFIVVSGFLGAIIVIAFVGFTCKYIKRQYRLGKYDEEKWYLKLVFLGKVPLHPRTPLSDAVVLIEQDPGEERIMLPPIDPDDTASWRSDHSDDEYPGNIMLPSEI